MSEYNLIRLKEELANAGIVVADLGAVKAQDGSVRVHTYSDTGDIVDLPAQAASVLAAHVLESPLTDYAGMVQIGARKRTTTATSAELYRATLAQRTGYRASLTLIAVDAGNGAVRTIEARITAKRLTNGALLVGAPVVVSDHQDAGTAAWGITASVSGNDFVVTVTGAAGRNIDWLLDGRVISFAPGGRS